MTLIQAQIHPEKESSNCNSGAEVDFRLRLTDPSAHARSGAMTIAWTKNHHVVVRDLDAHSALELCESHSSVGPDFVSAKEGVYCDMCTHGIWNYLLRDDHRGLL